MGKGNGKGEGKGGFLDEIWELGQKIVGCACCLLFIGPILIIVGIVFLVMAANDPRSGEVSDYNAIVKNWEGQNYEKFKKAYCADESNCDFSVIMSHTDGNFSGTAAKSTAVTALADDNDDYDTYTQALWFTGAVSYTVDKAQTTTISISNSVSNTTVNVDLVQCRKWESLSDFSFNADCGEPCDSSQDLAIGSRDNCNGYSYEHLWNAETDDECDDDDGCGTTTGTTTCTSDEMKEFPLSGSHTASTTFTVRSNTDPYYYAGDDTSCSYDFGLTAGEAFAIGLSCLVIGIGFCAAWGVAIYCLINRNRNDKKNAYKADEPYPGGPDQVQMNAQPYGAPPQPYGAPAQPYGAPPQPYGAPPQPYGSPPWLRLMALPAL
ncbi:hypothetical protein CYMTET_21342 [Cymbomonas tetramitiformis]|uniref:Uncharacterized protein n=1 Tax=Cymbomonas tetramitiformis TaxID=36881 RepID=A0AAE0G264_9CHLO|nr:hypothetical protein CYMTET_21342 [Cymbomonas tetramitiformis]